MRHDSAEEYADSFGLLADQRRLYALLCLREREEPIAVPSLAREIAVREFGSGEVPDDVAERVHVSLLHVHIPKLREAGILAYDSERVELTDDADTVEHVLDVVFDGGSDDPGG